MKINLSKMQDKIDKLMTVFTGIVNEIDEQTKELEEAINVEDVVILEAEERKREYTDTLKERAALRDKIISIIR